MTADAENKYYQVSAGEVDSQHATSGHWFKMPQTSIALIGTFGSCLMVVLMGASIISGTAFQRTNAATSTNLVGLLPSLRSSAGSVKPSFPNAMGHAVLPGSSPFKKIALAAIEANNLRNQIRDVSMRVATQPQEKLTDEELSKADSRAVSAKVATQAQEKLKDELSKADAQTKATVTKLEKAVAFKVEDMPGVTEPLGFFDPLGLSSKVSQGRLLFFREVEIKHGRVAMLATLGILVGEHFHPMFGGNIDVPSYIAFQQTPLQTFWPAVVAAIAIPEIFFGLYTVKPDDVGVSARLESKFEEDVSVQTLFLTNRKWTMKEGHVSGDWGFDPLDLKPNDGWIEGRAQKWKDMQSKELNNGRLAMIAAAGMIAQELATGQKIR